MTRMTYAHCTFATPGKMDRYPFTHYENAAVDVEVRQLSPDWILGETQPSYEVRLGSEIIGGGDTYQEAIGNAAYTLMDRSRTAAGFCLTV